MGCDRVKIKNRRVCIGDLNIRIKIQTRTLESNNTATIELVENFTDVVEVWAAVNTTRGSQLFDGSEISNPFTHIFYIRHRSNIDFEKWIEYKDEKYDIVDVENLDTDDNFLLMKCIKKGTKDNAANFV